LFKIFETNQFIKDINKLDGSVQRKIYDKIVKTIYPQIKNNPYFGNNIKKLRSYQPGTWRYRLGDFRLFYEIDDKEKIISILTMDKRENLY